MTNIFLYWQNENGKTTPPYIEMCLETLYKYNSHIDIVLVNQKNLHNYINVPPNLFQIKKIAQIADFIRVALLFEHGGIWLDSDCIILKSLDNTINMLNKYDYLGYKDKKNKISNGFIGANKKTKLISSIYEQLLFKINKKTSFQWTELGSQTITKCYENMFDKTNTYLYDTHFFSPIDWRNSEIFFKNIEIEQVIPTESIAIMLYNEIFTKKNNPIKEQSRQQILEQNALLSKLFKKNILTFSSQTEQE